MKNAPHIIIGIRPQDPVPDWTTHLALIRADGTVHTGEKHSVMSTATYNKAHRRSSAQTSTNISSPHTGNEMITLAGVSVTYGDRKVRLTPLKKPKSVLM